eukprot:2147023-Pyramimonas_sp.AAC.1
MPQHCSQDDPTGPKTAPRRLQDASKTSKGAPKRPKSFKYPGTINDCCRAFSPFGFWMAFRGSKRAPASREAQESPKAAPRASKSDPGWVQKASLSTLE